MLLSLQVYVVVTAGVCCCHCRCMLLSLQVYATKFSEDQDWYRCKVVKYISDSQVNSLLHIRVHMLACYLLLRRATRALTSYHTAAGAVPSGMNSQRKLLQSGRETISRQSQCLPLCHSSAPAASCPQSAQPRKKPNSGHLGQRNPAPKW